jgi:hypothetical protein
MKKKITIVRTCGKNTRRKNCEESVSEYPIRKKVRWKAKKEMDGRC